MSQFAFGAGVLWGTPLQDAFGYAIANPTPIQFGTLQDVSIDMSFDLKTLIGQNMFPVAAGRGKGKISGKAKFAQLNGAILNSLFFGQTLNASGISDVYDTTGINIPATPFTITASATSDATHIQIPSSGSWSADLGVRNASGLPMTRVASGPTTGQYTVAAGVYVFAAADTGNQVFINYQYTYASTLAKSSTILNVPMGYAPTFRCDMFVPYAGKSLILTLPTCVGSKLAFATKLDDFLIPEFDFEALANAAGQVMTYATSE